MACILQHAVCIAESSKRFAITGLGLESTLHGSKSHLCISKPLGEKLQSRTKAQPSCLFPIHWGLHNDKEPTRCSSSPSIHCVQPRPSFSPFCTHWSLSPSQLTVVCQATSTVTGPERAVPEGWGRGAPNLDNPCM